MGSPQKNHEKHYHYQPLSLPPVQKQAPDSLPVNQDRLIRWMIGIGLIIAIAVNAKGIAALLQKISFSEPKR